MRALLLAAGLVLALATPAHAADAVVGFVDTGINPYHKEFRDRSARALQHPSTYLPGFPKEAQALNLTLDAPSWKQAVATDCEVWQTVSEKKLYWIPGTKIVGAIAFRDKPEEIDCEEGEPTDALMLDTNGHGTMVASRAAANDYGACKTCRIVAIHYPNNGFEEPAPYQEALRWAAANRTWLDVQSNSWGPIVTAYEPTGTTILASNPPLIRTIEATASVQLAFWASMNGAAGRGGALGHPTQLAPHLTPSVLSVGGHDSGYMTLWTGFPPHAAADACNAFGAYHDHVDKSEGTVSSGTSGATPYVAGGAAQILLEARALLGDTRTGTRGDAMTAGTPGLVAGGPLADGVLSREEWRRLVLATASRRPESQPEDAEVCLTGLYDPVPVKWTDVPDDYPEYLHIGYGAVDRAGVALATEILRGTAQTPDRTATDEFFARDDEMRRQFHAQYTGGQAEDPPAAVPADAPQDQAAPAPAAPAPPQAQPATTAPAPRVRLRDLARVRCARGKLVVRIKPGFTRATVRVGRARARGVKRGTLRLASPRRRTKIAVAATDRTGVRRTATATVGRCGRR